MKSKIIYGCILAVTLMLCFIFSGKLPEFLLTFEIVLLPIAFFQARKQRECIEGRVVIPASYIQKQQEFEVEVHLKSNSLMPMPSVPVKVYCENQFTKEKDIFKERAMVDGKGEVILKLTLKSRYCGKVFIGIDEVRVQDYLRLFSEKVKIQNKKNEIVVLPRIHKITLWSPKQIQERQQGEEYSHARSGEDTSEVFDFHEYRQGDTLQRIHWKLSAKTDSYMVKEFSFPTEQMVLLFLDLHYPKDKEFTQEDLDLFLEILASLSWSMREQGWKHSIIWYNDKTGNLQKITIESESEVYVMLEQICDCQVYEEEKDIVKMYAREQEVEKVSNHLLLNAQGILYRNKSLEKQFNRQDLEKELVEWKLEM